MTPDEIKRERGGEEVGWRQKSVKASEEGGGGGVGGEM